MNPLVQARLSTRLALASAQSPAVLCSFGKDSLLVLALAREINQHVPVLWYRTGQNETFARRIIGTWNLTAFSPSPSDVYLLSNGTDHTMIHEYAFGASQLPVLTDVISGERCALTAFPVRTPSLHLPFDVVLTGWKDTDTHWIKGDTPLAEDWSMLGRSTIVAPVRHMTDTQVREAIYNLGLPQPPPETDLPLCTNCMTGGPNEVYCPERKRFISVHAWEADKSLTAFKQRFGLENTNGQNLCK